MLQSASSCRLTKDSAICLAETSQLKDCSALTRKLAILSWVEDKDNGLLNSYECLGSAMFAKQKALGNYLFPLCLQVFILLLEPVTLLHHTHILSI